MSHPVITLTTDFGLADGYVGTMKAVILSICPKAVLVDITHDIAPQATRQAAYVLSTATPYSPPGSVHLVVVDPGVGSPRRPIVVRTAKATYVAPDNGVLSLALARDGAHLEGNCTQRQCVAVHLTEPRYRLQPTSATFHGRDIFAPAAAYLASGIDPLGMGEEIPVSSLVNLRSFEPVRKDDGTWLGEVVHIDRFGNLVTSFREAKGQGRGARDKTSDHPARIAVEVGRARIQGLDRTFSDVARGELVAYIGSSGHLEIAEREGSAAESLGVHVGDPALVRGMSTELLFDPTLATEHHESGTTCQGTTTKD